MPTSEGLVGELLLSKGAQRAVRLGPYGEGIVNDVGYGRYFEATRLGRVYSLTSPAAPVALAAANLSPLAAGTGQPLVGIFNPTGSGKAASIIFATVLLQSGAATPLASLPVWNFIPNPTSITAAGSAGAIRHDLPSTVSSSVMRTFVNTALTGSVVATMVRNFLSNSQITVSGTANQVQAIFSEEPAGGLIVPPGAFLGIAVNVSTATEFYSASMVWAEVDWPL